MVELCPIDGTGAIFIEKNSSGDYRVVMEDRSRHFISSDGSCSCGQENDEVKTYGRREGATIINEARLCNHYIAAMKAVNLGACNNCGEFKVKEIKKFKSGVYKHSEYKCYNCGRER